MNDVILQILQYLPLHYFYKILLISRKLPINTDYFLRLYLSKQIEVKYHALFIPSIKINLEIFPYYRNKEVLYKFYSFEVDKYYGTSIDGPSNYICIGDKGVTNGFMLLFQDNTITIGLREGSYGLTYVFPDVYAYNELYSIIKNIIGNRGKYYFALYLTKFNNITITVNDIDL
jgi:hypothetical protein